MPPPDPTVFVVDDDEALCEALQWLLESAALRVEAFHSAEAFLDAYDPQRPGCLVLDLRMRGMNGLDLQARLARDDLALPVIIITGHGDIPLAVRAMKGGAVDFLEKPVDDRVLLERIQMALGRDARNRAVHVQRADILARLATLSHREREVLEQVVAARPSKQIAIALGITEKTVEVHRKHILQKMRVRSSVELVRAVLATRPAPDGMDPM